MARATKCNRQQGAVLLITLIFLLLLTMVGVTSMRLGTLELLMASNEQARVEAFLYSQALADGVLQEWKSNFVTDKKICSDGTLSIDCDTTTNILMESTVVAAVASVDTSYFTKYIGETTAPYSATSATEVDVPVFLFRLETFYDNTANRQGKSEIVEGVRIFNPAAKGAAVHPDGDIDKYLHILFD